MAAPTDSNVALCNRVISRLGSTDFISSLSDDKRNARILNQNFEFLRDVLNADHPWNWAIKRSTLAVDSGATPNHEFAYSYTLPTDYMKLVRDADEVDGVYEDYRIEGNYYVTDQGSVKIEYVARIEDLNAWGELAREALVELLMAECGTAIADKSASYIQARYQLYEQKLLAAKSRDAQEGRPRALVANTWVNARNQTQGTGNRVSDFY